MTEYEDWDATEISQNVAAGKVSSEEIVRAAVLNAKSRNPQLNAIVFERYDKAIQDAAAYEPDSNQPFQGVPFTVKDLSTPEKGERLAEGNIRLKQNCYTAPLTSTAMEKARQGGLISIGRTSVPEFSAGNCPATSETEAFGPTRNPWALDRTPMGSSGGAAVTVAAGIVPIAHGTDGGGSVRLPASACGIVGLKVSRGRISMGPNVGERWYGCASHGLLARSIRDTATMLDCLSGPVPGDHYTAPEHPGGFRNSYQAQTPSYRIGVISPDREMSDTVRNALDRTVQLLVDAGHRVEEAHPEGVGDEELWRPAFGAVIAAEVYSRIQELTDEVGGQWTADDMEKGTWEVYEAGSLMSAQDYITACRQLNQLSRRVAQFWHGPGGFDLFLSPVMNHIPPKIGYLVEDHPDRSDRIYRQVSTTALFNIGGQPAISLPLEWSDDGLPIGMQFVAAYGREDKLLSLGAQLEMQRPWAPKLRQLRQSFSTESS